MYGPQELLYVPAADSPGKQVPVLTLANEHQAVQKKLEMPIQVQHHRVVAFQVKATAKQPTLYLHQQAELDLEITAQDPQAKHMTYQLASLESSLPGKLQATPGGAALQTGATLGYSTQRLYYDPQGQVGEHQLALTITNPKGDQQTAQCCLTFQDPGFFVQAAIQEMSPGSTPAWSLVLEAGAAHPAPTDAWYLTAWQFSKGIQATLHDTGGDRRYKLARHRSSQGLTSCLSS